MKYILRFPELNLLSLLKNFLHTLKTDINELKDLKEQYVSLLKQKTLLDLEGSEKENESYDFIIRNYEAKLKYLFHKRNDNCNEKPLSKSLSKPLI